jgi:hypothetical protein
MAEKNPSAGRKDKSFEEYLRESPAARDVTGPVTMVGAIARSTKDDEFVLMTGGQTIELPVDAVESYRVVQESGTQRVLELQLNPARVRERLAKGPVDTLKEGPFDTLKEQPFDTIKEQPFDTVKEQPFDTIKEQPFDTIKEQPFDTLKEQTHDTLKEGPFDTFKESIKDPIADPITIQEVATPGKQLGDPIDPGQLGGMVNPAAGFMGAVPFVMATPHHAPQEVIARQAAAAGMPQMQAATVHFIDMTGSSPAIDQIQTIHVLDSPRTTPLIDVQTLPHFDHAPTLKELIKDPLQDPVTWVEGAGGSIMEQPGGGFQPPVWNLPGMMF